MPRFLVRLEGGPVELPAVQGMAEQPLRVGFFSTRKVHASSEAEAIRLAIDDASTELRGTTRPVPATPPQWSVDEIWVPRWYKARWRRYRGFTFYPWPETDDAA